MNRRSSIEFGLFSAFALLWLSGAALAEDFYKDKIIRFIVGQAAGGGYDAYTRAIARHMIKHIPGNPAVTVENMTGAGSLVSANYLYNQTKPDGLTVANWNSAFVLNQALGDPNVRFDARRFGWIGAPSKGVPVCVIMGFTGLATSRTSLNRESLSKWAAPLPAPTASTCPSCLTRCWEPDSTSFPDIRAPLKYGWPCSGAKSMAIAPIGNQ
jgi:hypothetical protein